MRPRILTTYAKARHPAWLRRVELMEDFDAEMARTWGKPQPAFYQLGRDLLWAWRLFRRSRRYDAVVAGSGRMSRLFAIAQRLLRRNPVPLVYIDWYCNPTGGWVRRRVQRVAVRWALLGASKALVQGRQEVGVFARGFGVPASKFTFLPYHSTVYDFSWQAKEGDYIFSGGDSYRDYRTLIEAVRGLGYRVLIAALRRDHFREISIPANVEIMSLSKSEFFQKMAAAALVVVPMQAGVFHPGGQQTWINAMVMSKPVIVAEDRCACDYIVHATTGWLVKPGDPAALREAIRLLMEDRNLARVIGKRAQEAAAQFSPERFFEGVFGVLQECLEEASKG
jgi:glycosyltransferase involved in cell wall biosynthesis